MSITLTLEGIAQFATTVLVILALVFLVIVLKKLGQLVTKISALLDDNKNEIDIVLKNAPEITLKVKSIVSHADDWIVQAGPDVREVARHSSTVAKNVSDMSKDLSDTVNFISENAVDTVSAVRNSVYTTTDYIDFIIQVIDIVKKVILK
jgi:predicted PurR-regulated permease PerM